VKALLACDATREVSGVPDGDIDRITAEPKADSGRAEQLTKPMTANNVGRKKSGVRSTAGEGAWPLFDLVANNQAIRLKERMAENFDPNVQALHTEETLLHAAVAYGATECVELLIAAKADVNAKTLLYAESPLHLAIQEGFFDIFHDLIRAGADIESQNCEGEGPLFTAVKYNRVEMFRVLVRKGANVNQVNFGGLTSLHFAVLDANEFLSESLLWHGADPRLGELNPYLYAFRAGDSAIADRLQTVAPSLSTETRLTPGIFDAIKADDVEALDAFLTKGFEINLVDVLQGAPIHCAVEHGSFNCLKLLIANGADVNLRAIQRLETPIHIAIRKGNRQIYRYLLEQNIDFSLKNKDGENAVFYGVRHGQPEVLVDAIQRGADVNDVNGLGRTPLYVAVSLKKTKIVENLIGDFHADPSVEVHPSLRLSQQMGDDGLTTLISNQTAPTANLRTARIDARKARKSRATTAVGGRGRRGQPVEVAEPVRPHTEGHCYLCERNPATQKLIPCGHIVSCRGCIRNFIEDHPPCPQCHLNFYATASQVELPK
jgi:ankyrin repeat protein